MSSVLPLKLINVSYKVGDKIILDNISTEIKKGLPKVILGPNGAGKRSLMKICHGLINPTSGSVFWSHPKTDNFSTKHTMVFQRPVMLRRSVKNNLLFVLRDSLKKEKKINLLKKALELVDLESVSDCPARNLSQGEQQKLALARAWLLNPEVLFLDEPTANLDPESTEKVEYIIETISKNGTQVLMTTHNIAQAKRVGKEVLFLYNGKLIEQRNCNDFFSSPRTEKAKLFINSEKII